MAKNKGDIGLSKKPDVHISTSLSLQGFVLITEDNRKQAVVIGRIFYNLTVKNGKNILGGFWHIWPCMKKGWVHHPYYPWDFEHPYIKDTGRTHWKFYQEKDDNYIKWVRTFKERIDKGIKDSNLYIRTTDPILKY